MQIVEISSSVTYVAVSLKIIISSLSMIVIFVELSFILERVRRMPLMEPFPTLAHDLTYTILACLYAKKYENKFWWSFGIRYQRNKWFETELDVSICSWKTLTPTVYSSTLSLGRILIWQLYVILILYTLHVDEHRHDRCQPLSTIFIDPTHLLLTITHLTLTDSSN